MKEEPSSKEKRDRRKDDGKGRRRDKPNNLVQVQLLKGCRGIKLHFTNLEKVEKSN
jgi:hypothetical protein